MSAMDRRQILALSLLPLAYALPLRADEGAAAALIASILNGKTPGEGGLRFDLPPLAENGNAVPFTVTVNSAMTADDHIRAIHLISARNPRPEVATFRLTQALGRAVVSTRIKLAGSQTLTALAEHADGSILIARAAIVVTLAACIEDLG